MIAYYRGHFVDTLSWSRAGERPGAGHGWNGSGARGSWEVQIKKNRGNEAKKYLKTKEER